MEPQPISRFQLRLYLSEPNIARRFLLSAALCLTFGTVVTIAIAWASALFVQPERTRLSIQFLKLQWSTSDVHRWNSKTVKRIECASGSFGGGARPTDAEFRQRLHLSACETYRTLLKSHPGWPWWAGTPSLQCDAQEVWAGTVQDARGWPFPALRSEWTDDAAETTFLGRSKFKPASLMIELPLVTADSLPPDPSNSWYLRSLPLTPVWRGLIADSFLFGLLPFAFVGSRHIRQWRRQRNGWCPKCAYDLPHNLSSGCPECGWNRRPNPPLG